VRGGKLIPVGGLARLLWACPSPAPDTPTGLNPVGRFADKLRADRRPTSRGHNNRREHDPYALDRRSRTFRTRQP
jgi:hypothetical protein